MISRRQFFLGSAAALSACGGESDKQMDMQGVPPWHLWGSTQDFVVDVAAPGNSVGASSQVAHVSYKRPDTWTFFFAMQINECIQANPADTIVFDAFFDLTLGVGRSSVTIPSFEHYRFLRPGGLLPQLFYSQSVEGPIRDTTAVVIPPNVIREIPSQDIQLTVRLAMQTTLAAAQIRGTCTGYFSPRSHVRPEWHGTASGTTTKGNNTPRFPAGEDKGA